MTGFGKAEVKLKQFYINIEIRSLNSKFLDLSLKTPSFLKEIELSSRSIIKKEINRGKVELTIHYEKIADERNIVFNKDQISNYYQQIKELKSELGDHFESDLIAQILNLPDIINHEKAEIEKKEIEKILNGIKVACDNLNEYRTKEGNALEKVIRSYVKNIQQNIKEVEKFEEQRLPKIKSKLNKAIEELNLKDKLDTKRLEQELIYYSEKLDITEEKVRLNEHCNYFLKTINESHSGKKLGFITQEMGREINTRSSKRLLST